MTETPTVTEIVVDANVIDPTAEAARQMARTIRAAHALSPSCWSVYTTKNRVAVMVGNCVVGGGSEPGKYDTVLTRELLSDEELTELDQIQVTKIPKGYPQLTFPRLPDGDVFTQLAGADNAHRDALAVLTATIKKAATWKSYREDLKARIEALAGVTLPSPAYLSDMHKVLVESEPVEPPPPEPSPDLDTVRDHFAANGLHYTETQVATFVTALQTKGFMVLSGISGTGKSKIATGFVEMLPSMSGLVKASQVDAVGPQPITVVPDMIKRRRIVIPIRYHDMLPPMDPGSSQQFRVSVADKRGTGRLWFRVIRSTEQYFLFFYQDLADEVGQWQVGQLLYLDPILNSEGDRVLEIDISYEQPVVDSSVPVVPVRLGSTYSNHLFLSVRPDWRDSTSLLGYYNPLTQTYEWTDFLQFVIRAGENYRGDPEDRIAWFVILDEMNLAHVEYYFADLLSVLESGRDADGWTREALRIKFPDTLADDVPPERVFLPPNLYIIGTVNMDETTHAFSPKVLDRAFTIELTDVDFFGYDIAGSAGDATLSEDEKRALLRAFSRGGRFARIDKAEAAKAVDRHEEIRTCLQSLNALLRENRMHFGYRVFDEIAMYLAVNDENRMMLFEDAFDQAVFMKVLPKFTGSLARLRSPLHKVLAWAIDPERVSRDDVTASSQQFDAYQRGIAPEAWTTVPRFPVVAGRVRDMLVTLETDGFVSFG